MKVTFALHPRKLADGTSEEVEFVTVSTGRDGRDVVKRPATDRDRVQWHEEYAAFVGPSDAPAVETAPATAPTSKKKRKDW